MATHEYAESHLWRAPSQASWTLWPIYSWFLALSGFRFQFLLSTLRQSYLFQSLLSKDILQLLESLESIVQLKVLVLTHIDCSKLLCVQWNNRWTSGNCAAKNGEGKADERVVEIRDRLCRAFCCCVQITHGRLFGFFFLFKALSFNLFHNIPLILGLHTE